MRVINSEKEQARIYLRSDIDNVITNVTHESNEMHNTVLALNDVLSGACSGMDARFLGSCQKVLQDLSMALQALNHCRELVNRIDVSEEIPDEQYQ